jgi:thiamine thiazole synthase
MIQQRALFSPAGEKDVTRAIVREFAAEFDQYVESDVIIVGAGPSGLVAGMLLCQAAPRTLIVERNNYLGGGFWIGGYLMNKVTVREPAETLLADIGVPLKAVGDGLHVADGPHACSKLIAAACDAGVKFANMTSVDDVIIRKDNRVAGAVINWTPVHALPRSITCVDPVAIECRMMVEATGHDAVVARLLAQRGLLTIAGMGAMWVERSEESIVEKTGEVYPGLVAVGMSVSTIYGLPRMGPTFGGMLLSGQRGARYIIEALKGGRPAGKNGARRPKAVSAGA